MKGRAIGYAIMRVQIDGISGYDEDQVALVAHSSTEFAHKAPIILGYPLQIEQLLLWKRVR